MMSHDSHKEIMKYWDFKEATGTVFKAQNSSHSSPEVIITFQPPGGS